MGTAFNLVKKDVTGNIEKLHKTYNKSPDKYKYLDDLICSEKHDPSVFAVDALLWLKRALEFTAVFMTSVCNEIEKGDVNEKLDHVAVDAYNRTLKKYHNWMVQNLFKMVVRGCPSLPSLIQTLLLGQSIPTDQLLHDAREFVSHLETNIEVIVRFYTEWGLDNERKV